MIYKTDDDHPKRMTKEAWVKVDVITIAAPDLRSKSNMYAAIVGNGTYMNNAELFGYHVKRAMHMLTVAASKGEDILVLGAFGCGAFQNDPAVVAKAYKIAPEELASGGVSCAMFCWAADDPLRLGIGSNPVCSREETNLAPLKRTHMHAKSAYMKQEYTCKI